MWDLKGHTGEFCCCCYYIMKTFTWLPSDACILSITTNTSKELQKKFVAVRSLSKWVFTRVVLPTLSCHVLITNTSFACSYDMVSAKLFELFFLTLLMVLSFQVLDLLLAAPGQDPGINWL